MINNKELEIANISYTNKDFGTVYTEVLDIARKISDLWSPQSSNESDPGVVLLKLLAFMADKINYNMDKNILETMMPSATQESSMRKLCDMMGYYMNYYTSASTYVTFTYKGSALDITNDDENVKYIQMPKFQTVVSNDDNSLQYVLWEDVSLDSTSKYDTVLAKEGYLNVLNVGDSDKITLENLDSQRRIYFGESQVAQNGILIRAYNSADSGATFWTRVENLNVQDPGATCFKFGYDSKEQLPYIEFPQDIASIIGEGLYIRYLVTSGYYGNVGVGNLSKLLSPTSVNVYGGLEETVISFTDEDGNSTLNIKNNSAATNGANPESIDSAYNNFKKTVGTFQTLVTCRDYANYIYRELYTSSGNHLVSNVQVADRRTDINHSNIILTYDDVGQHTVNNSTDYTKLFIYALRGINNPSNQSEYKESFMLVNNQLAISDDLNRDDSAATISYEYQYPSEDDIALIKILYNLDVKITTTYKVNVAEQLDIKKNVIEALRQKFFSRNIDYGYEIPYDTIYNCIMDADDRIKSIILKEPELGVSYIENNRAVPECGTSAGKDLGGTTVPYADSPYLFTTAKNVLAGRIPLFDYDTRFEYEFGMTEYKNSGTTVGPVLSHVEEFFSEAAIELVEGTPYVVGENEVIQLIGPQLADEMEFSTYVNYRTNRDFEANTDTKLGADEYILFIYTDSSQNQVEVLYTEGAIIRSTYNIDHSWFSDTTRTKVNKILQNESYSTKMPDCSSTTIPCLGIPTKESIIKRTVVRHVFDSSLKASWWVNDIVEENRIDTKFIKVDEGTVGDPHCTYEFILGDSDYFIYSIDGESSYEIFGSGTSLRLESDSANSIEISDIFNGICNIPDLNDLYEYGLESISAILKNISFAAGITFTIQANDILTLAQGDTVNITGNNIELVNSWQEFDSDHTMTYQLLDSDTEEDLSHYNLGSYIYDNWRIRSRLDLVAGSSKTQKLLSHHTISFRIGSDWYDIYGSNNGRLRTNLSVDISGGDNIPLTIVDPTSAVIDEDGEPIYPLSVLVFTDPNNKSENFVRSSGYCVKEISTDGLDGFNYNILPITDLSANHETLIMMHVSFLSDKFGSITIKGYASDNAPMDLINYSDGSELSVIYDDSSITPPHSAYIQDGKSKMFIFKVPTNCVRISITTSSTSSIGTLIVGTITETDGLNSRFNLSKLESQNQIASGALDNALKQLVAYMDTEEMFYYNAPLDASEEIDEEDLSSPYALFDANNMAGKFALAYVDIDGSSIEITRSSKL